MDLVMTFIVKSNNVEMGREGGSEMYLRFPFVFKGASVRWKAHFKGECLNNFGIACS